MQHESRFLCTCLHIDSARSDVAVHRHEDDPALELRMYALLVKQKLTSKCRPVSTPEEDMNDDTNEFELSGHEEIRSFRADAARGYLLTMHRSDRQFRAEEISRAMSKPMKKDQRRMIRMAKYLNKRVQQEFKFERLHNTITVFADSAWAGCSSSRKGTSSGVVSTNIGVVKTLEFDTEVSGVVVVWSRVARHEQGCCRLGGQKLSRRHEDHAGSCEQTRRRKDAPH